MPMSFIRFYPSFNSFRKYTGQLVSRSRLLVPVRDTWFSFCAVFPGVDEGTKNRGQAKGVCLQN